uniref:(northern house mosquito) hypothetical protein n=1 Tax=Culex pipiens TaxID=7175 RepID=A0A8D8C8T2_CULPI
MPYAKKGRREQPVVSPADWTVWIFTGRGEDPTFVNNSIYIHIKRNQTVLAFTTLAKRWSMTSVIQWYDSGVMEAVDGNTHRSSAIESNTYKAAHLGPVVVF